MGSIIKVKGLTTEVSTDGSIIDEYLAEIGKILMERISNVGGAEEASLELSNPEIDPETLELKVHFVLKATFKDVEGEIVHVLWEGEIFFAWDEYYCSPEFHVMKIKDPDYWGAEHRIVFWDNAYANEKIGKLATKIVEELINEEEIPSTRKIESLIRGLIR